MKNLQSLYQTALKYAATRHEEKQQKIPGSDLPYVVHLSNVAMETLIASYNTADFDVFPTGKILVYVLLYLCDAISEQGDKNSIGDVQFQSRHVREIGE